MNQVAGRVNQGAGNAPRAVKRPSGLADGESWVGGERVCIAEACLLSEADLEEAYVYSLKSAPNDSLPPALLKAFPDLLLPQARASLGTCSALCPSGPLHVAAARGLDVEAIVKRARPISSAPKIYRRGRVSVTYAPAEIANNPPATEQKVTQPGGRTLDGQIDAGLNGVPSRVQRLAIIAEDAIKRLTELGLQAPAWSEANPLEIRVRRSEGAEDYGWTSDLVSFIEINPTMPSVQDFSVVPHEIAHRFQIEARKLDSYDNPALCAAIREGGARLLEDYVFEGAKKYVADAEFHFQNPEFAFFTGTRPYATGLFWKYLAERYETAPPAPSRLGIYRELLAVVKQRGYTFNALQELCARVNTRLEDVWGDFLLKNLLHNLSSEHAYRNEHQAPNSRADGARQPLSALEVHFDQRTIRDLEPWAAAYHAVEGPGQRKVALTRILGGPVNAKGIHFGAGGRVRYAFDVPIGERPKPVTLEDAERLVLIAWTVDSGALFQIAVT